MSAWQRLVRFEDEQGKIQLGEPVDASQDVGLAVANGEKVEVKLIQGDLYDGTVTDQVATVKKVSFQLILTTSPQKKLTGELPFSSITTFARYSCLLPSLVNNAA